MRTIAGQRFKPAPGSIGNTCSLTAWPPGGVHVGNRRFPQDRNLQRCGQHLVHGLDVPHPGPGSIGRRYRKGLLQCGSGPHRPGLQDHVLLPVAEPHPLGQPALRAAQLPRSGAIRFHRLGCPNVLCCVGAVNRIVPNYVMHMWMATPDRGLAATLYGPCSVSTVAGQGVPIQVTCRTAYPFEESIQVRVEPQRKASFPLYFRIPGWCPRPRVALNGHTMDAKPGPTGFLRIAREWTPGDVIELAFDQTDVGADGIAYDADGRLGLAGPDGGPSSRGRRSCHSGNFAAAGWARRGRGSSAARRASRAADSSATAHARRPIPGRLAVPAARSRSDRLCPPSPAARNRRRAVRVVRCGRRAARRVSTGQSV